MPDVTVVGGGIIGCATALFLAREGASVAVLERGEVSGEASGAAAGMLAALSGEGERPEVFQSLCDQSLAAFESLLPVLLQTGIDIRHRRTDILHLALTEAEAAALHAYFARQTDVPGVSWLEGEDLRRAEPAANPTAVAGVVTPAAQYVDPRRLTQALAAAARAQGVEVLEHTPALRLPRRQDRATGIESAERTFESDQVLLAAGPWSMAIAGRLGAHVPTRPVRGQMLSLQSPEGGLRHMIWGSRAYLVPREDGQTYVGATVEDVGYRKHTTRAGLASLRAGAASLIPHFGRAAQRKAWAGLRPGSPDGLPIMGKLPGWANVWVSTGHFRNGILLAPISGKLMAEAMLSDTTGPLPPALSVTRFAE